MRATRLDTIIRSALHLYKHHLNESVKWIKPELYGPTHTVLFRRLLAYSINLSIILAITSLALSPYNHPCSLSGGGLSHTTDNHRSPCTSPLEAGAREGD